MKIKFNSDEIFHENKNYPQALLDECLHKYKNGK